LKREAGQLLFSKIKIRAVLLGGDGKTEKHALTPEQHAKAEREKEQRAKSKQLKRASLMPGG
jgi:hypothetical protein